MRSRFTPTREQIAPKGATKVCDKHSDAVAFLSVNKAGKPTAMLFVGKQSKPLWFYQFPNEQRREIKITEAFKARQEHIERVKANRAEPSSTAQRNAKLKEVLSEHFGKGKVTVRGSRGTAYGWVTVRIDVTPNSIEHRRELEAKVWSLINANKIHIGTYDSADYGAGREIHIEFNRVAQEVA